MGWHLRGTEVLPIGRKPRLRLGQMRRGEAATFHLFVNFFRRFLERLLSRGPAVLPPGCSRAARGSYGESLAARHCERELGYRILARNWRHKRDELDLVCLDGAALVFIEVRARAADALVSGYHSIGVKKMEALRRACKAYLRQLQNPPKHFRFDVIDVALVTGERGEVRHYANVPLFHKHYTADQ